MTVENDFFQYRYLMTGEGARHFDTIAEYIDNVANAFGKAEGNFPRSAIYGRLCTALEAEVLQKRDPGMPRTGWVGFPWVTLVLGSGVGSPTQLEYVTPKSVCDLADGCMHTMPGMVEDFKELEDRDWRDWVKSLVASRTPWQGTAEPPHPVQEPRGEPGQDASDATGSARADTSAQQSPYLAAGTLMSVLAFRVGRAFHKHYAVGREAPRRRSVDRVNVEVDAPEAARITRLLHKLAGPKGALRSVRGLGDGLPAQQIADWLKARFLPEFADDNGSTQMLRISLADLEMQSELCWYFLRAVPAGGNNQRNHLQEYPGWTDLMVRMRLQAEKFDPRSPAWDSLPAVSSAARDAIWPIMKASFEARPRTTAVGGDFDHTFHGAAAQLLTAQARAREQYMSLSLGKKQQEALGSLPLPSALVTSLDIELEIALFRAGRPFRVVMPVHVQTGGNSAPATLMWYSAIIQPPPEPGPEDFAALTQGQHWRILYGSPGWTGTGSAGAGAAIADSPNLPTIVRLTGSPAMVLPDLAKARAEFLRRALLRSTFDELIDLVGVATKPQYVFDSSGEDDEDTLGSADSDGGNAWRIVELLNTLRGSDETLLHALQGAGVDTTSLEETYQDNLPGSTRAIPTDPDTWVQKSIVDDEVESSAPGRASISAALLRSILARWEGTNASQQPEPPGMQLLHDLARISGTPIDQFPPDIPQNHAVVIDEYTAMQTSTAEVIGTYLSAGIGNRAELSPALPRGILESTALVPRYWLAVGVQVADPAVRLRLFSQVATVLMRRADPEKGGHATGSAALGPAVFGLAVNRNVQEFDSSLLSWLGISSVKGESSELIEPIQDLSRHVDAVRARLDEVTAGLGDGQSPNFGEDPAAYGRPTVNTSCGHKVKG